MLSCQQGKAFLYFAIVISIVHSTSTLEVTTNVPSRASIVTGANGFVGREIAHCLIRNTAANQIHNIYCLVRATRVPTETQYWESISPSIKVLEYDMLDGGTSLRKALEAACSKDNQDGTVVYHVASKFGPSDDHIQDAKENVKGTEDLVDTISQFEKCRLVLTSSMAAVRATGQRPSNGKFYTSEDWNTLSVLGDNWGSSYQWSKAESERRAWQIAKAKGVAMTSICPSFVFGPPSNGLMCGKSDISKSFSIELVGKWIRGESQVQSRLFVDVRDSAMVHVAAGNKPIAVGKRYIVSTEQRLPSEQLAEVLKKVCVESGLGNSTAITYDSNFTGGSIPIGEKEVSTLAGLAELGVTLRPVEETVYDMGAALLGAAKKG